MIERRMGQSRTPRPADTPDPRWLAEQPLRPSSILVAEFEYITQTAFQANEDRARTSAYYLAAVGSLVAGIVSSQFERLSEPQVCWAFSALFVVLTLIGLLALLQLARLRQAWFGSIVAMNEIKGFYVRHFEETMNLGNAFLWTNQEAPARFKPWSISFLVALQVGLVASITLGAAVVFAGLGSQAFWWDRAVAVGVGYLGLQVLLYWIAVRKGPPQRRKAAEQADPPGVAEDS